MSGKLTKVGIRCRLNFSMDTQPRFVKSFSKGQITIPKEFRDAFGVGNDFWLKLSLEQGKIVGEVVNKKVDKAAWKKLLLSLGTIDISMEEIRKNRRQWDKQIKQTVL